MNILKQSTAATIKFGPMVDDADGKTAETALTISQADIRLSKNGGDFAQTHNATGATHDENGYYDIPLDTTDTGTLGRLRVAVSESGALPVWQDFLVVTANVYDSLVGGSDKLDVNEILTDTGTTLDTLIKDVPTVSEFEARTKPTADYFDPAADTVANVTAVGTTTNLTNLPTMPADWLTASGLKADAVAEIQAGLALEATLTAMKGIGWTNETLVALMTAIETIVPGSGATAQEVWEYVTRTLTDPDSYKADVSALATTAHLQEVEDKVDTIDNFLDTEIAAILEDTGITLPATLAAIEGKVDTSDAVVDAIKLKTDNLPASPAATGAAMTLTAAYDKAKDDVLTPLGVVDGIVDSIKLKTDTIPASPAQAGEYTAAIAAIPTTPLLATNYTAPDNAGIAAIKAQTDLIPASPAPANEYDARMTAIQSDLDNTAQYKADVSGLALEATSQSILEDTGTTIPAAITGMNDIAVSDIMNEIVVGTYTFEQILKILAAKMAGKATGGNTTTITYRGLDDTSDVIVETVDSNGNRSAVTLTV